MLRNFKLSVLKTAAAAGLLDAIGRSNWRRGRLLILGYHGIAKDDEHLWRSRLFLPADLFRARMEYLRRSGCNVLPLREAIERLQRSDLPERSVVVTFDDGWHDFRELAFPILKELDIPATVYLTTYYVNFNRPVFDTMVSYLLWKTRRRTLSLTGIRETIRLEGSGAAAAEEAIRSYARRELSTGEEKDALLSELAQALEVDYGSILDKRILHLMNPAEVAEMSDAGIDIQLHTHRHGLSRRENWFRREIDENRKTIQQMCHKDAAHLCYPDGNHLPHFANWLEHAGIKSATTNETGLCTSTSNRYFLPRLLDSATLTSVEFAGWISGFANMLPKRPPPAVEEPFLEEWLPRHGGAGRVLKPPTPTEPLWQRERSVPVSREAQE